MSNSRTFREEYSIYANLGDSDHLPMQTVRVESLRHLKQLLRDSAWQRDRNDKSWPINFQLGDRLLSGKDALRILRGT